MRHERWVHGSFISYAEVDELGTNFAGYQLEEYMYNILIAARTQKLTDLKPNCPILTG